MPMGLFRGEFSSLQNNPFFIVVIQKVVAVNLQLG